MSERSDLLSARGLVKRFKSRSLLRGGTTTIALDHVDFDVHPGEVVALIGESGSGKTTLGKVVTRLHSLDEGSVLFEGEDLFAVDRGQLREKRRAFQMVFQNQSANLHPKMSVRQMLDESLRLHRPNLDEDGRRAHADELLERVGLLPRAEQRPASLSGGEKRRAGLARILATKPKLIVADEPTSGLDAAIKLQIIDLLKQLKGEKLTYLLISHDLGLVRRIADRVLVMLKGRIIEEVPAALLGQTQFHHPYTGRLMRAADLARDRRRPPRERRDPPRVTRPDEAEARGGCVYSPDCALAERLGILSRCRKERPPPQVVGENHWIACFGAPSELAEEDDA